MTVVGDIAQATGPRAPRGGTTSPAPDPTAAPTVVELTVSYRTPAEVVALAAQVLAVAAALHQCRPVRCVPFGLRAPGRRHQPGSGSRPSWPQLAREEVAAVAPGRVAVLGPRLSCSRS